MIKEDAIPDINIIGNQISNLIDTPLEQNFERLARMTKRMYDVPVIVIGLFDEKRKSIQPVVSLDFSDASLYLPFFKEFNTDDILVVEDATKNEAFKNHPLVVGDPMIRFIVMCPIFEKNGKKVGSLIMMDHMPRSLELTDLMSLNEIVKLIEAELCSFRISKAQKLFLQEISNSDKSRYIDKQTKAWNNEGCLKILNKQWAESKKSHKSFGFAVIDVDNLDQITNLYGKEIADEVLALTARTILTSCREEDTVGRGVNEDFMLIIHASELAHVKNIVQRIKLNLERIKIKLPGGNLTYNVTIGVSVFHDNMQQLETLVDNAHNALAKGKKSGSNCIEFDEAK